MKIRLVNPENINDYIAVAPQPRSVLGSWMAKVKHEQVTKPIDLVRKMKPARLLENECNRIVFSVNNHRIICQYIFERKRVDLTVCWIGTLAEYNRLTDDECEWVVSVPYRPPNNKDTSILK